MTYCPACGAQEVEVCRVLGHVYPINSDVVRCNKEIREIQERADVVAGSAPAWLVTLGVMDWTIERLAIEGQWNAGYGVVRMR